jgi:plasmid maintenance system antidote protein VapI
MWQLGVSQVQLAGDLGITTKHVNQMLTGRADGSLEIWVAMAGLLGMEWALMPRVNDRRKGTHLAMSKLAWHTKEHH